MTIEAKVTLAAESGIPADSVVNTFHFGQPGVPGVRTIQMYTDLAGFYNAVPTGSAYAIDEFLSSTIERTGLVHTIDWYNLDLPKPRLPFQRDTFALVHPPLFDTRFPNEVAVALSWHGPVVPGSSVVPGRNRGRTFVGPLIASSATSATGEDPRPSIIFQDTLLSAGTALINAFRNVEPLVVYSRGLYQVNKVKQPPVAPTARNIVRCSVDNAFDTIRSRGTAPTIRRFGTLIP